MKKIRVKVIVKVQDAWGKSCLSEFRTLKEGTVLEGTYNPANNAVDVRWNNEDGVLWVGSNCDIIKNISKKKTVRRLPKGYIISTYCMAISYHGVVYGGGCTRKEAVDEAINLGFSRDEFNIEWYVKDYHAQTDSYGVNFGSGSTKKEAIENFWENMK